MGWRGRADLKEVPDGVTCGAQNFRRIAESAVFVPDQLVQFADVDVGGVAAGQWQAVEQARGRLPGWRFVADAVSGNEVPGVPVHGAGQFRGEVTDEISCP